MSRDFQIMWSYWKCIFLWPFVHCGEKQNASHYKVYCKGLCPALCDWGQIAGSVRWHRVKCCHQHNMVKEKICLMQVQPSSYYLDLISQYMLSWSLCIFQINQHSLKDEQPRWQSSGNQWGIQWLVCFFIALQQHIFNCNVSWTDRNCEKSNINIY